ncbi:histidine kinase [Spirosoma radiotolerans]|uniref:histidine kinase n=1 Tax=Spirosoma radiotolerans TaxID=1379870 RepID=A0A0E3VAK8_9BACT|nr:histidine kinase [Spirosoma radiotolerans]
MLMGILVGKYKMSAAEDWVMIPMVMLVLLAMFSIPLGLSLSLVRDYARTYRTLQKKLQEVEQLSAQAMIQEQEKQQLLARQNEVLEHQVADRTAELTKSLSDLQRTQQQLIQKEKMASLGELTAGIAHEIQNPLNFVNNFSEVSDELVDELRAEQHKPVRDTGLETELLDDLKQNLQKITQHGKRASAIVKGMLEHSRSSSGEHQSINLNALADEYLQIAYQGLRAKDKGFTVELATDFGADLPLLEVIPQEIGRVLLNVYNNAFYAVRQKQKTTNFDYRPKVALQTRQENGRILIRVSDNGTGMPESVKEKIFQPFFTTKPTGEGTGLGLSLSYDIITNGHGGSLLVESQEGEGSAFIIELPNPGVE